MHNNNKYFVEININSMISIVFAILSAFIAATPMICGGESIVIPKSMNSQKNQKPINEQDMVIAIPENNIYYLGKDRIDIDQLCEKIKAMSKNKKLADRIVYIKCGNQVNYGSLLNTLVVVRKTGINRIGLVTKKG